MVPLMPAALLGFVVGLRHATEADHVAAVSAIVARERTVRGAALIGAAWGLGHTITLLLLGGAIVVFGLAVPRSVALSLELGVGAMLIGLGLWNVASGAPRRSLATEPQPAPTPTRWAARFLSMGRHAHAHGPGAGLVLAHEHVAPSGALRGASREGVPSTRRARITSALRPLAVGSMHGLAGSAGAALLVVAAVPGALAGLAYLVVFGLGSTLGMTLLTTVLALPLGGALRRFRGAEGWLRIGSGALSCVIGAVVVYQIGFHDGLFLR